MSLTKPLVEMIVDQMLGIWETADNWIKGAAAEDEDNENVDATSEYAVKWCLVGCRQRACHVLRLDEYDDEFNDMLDYYAKQMNYDNGRPYISAVSFNDDERTTFEDVVLFVKTLKDKEVPDQEEECDESC